MEVEGPKTQVFVLGLSGAVTGLLTTEERRSITDTGLETGRQG